MRSELSIWAISLGFGVLVLGCGKGKEEKSTPATPPAPPATQTAVPAAAPMPAAPAPALAPTPAPEATPAPAPAVTPEPAAPAASQPAAVSSAAVSDAQTQLTQVFQYIQENKLDLADKSLTQLDKIRNSLPASLQARVDQAHTALNAAKASNGNLPGGFKLPQ